MSECIEVNGLTKHFGTKTAVDNLSLHVSQGEVFGLLGHNGAGKSTTIDCILGLKEKDAGTAKILGMNPKQDRKKLFQKVGVQLQTSSYQDSIRVEEICDEISVLYEQPLDYRELLKTFKLDEHRRQPVDKLSGGEKQKLSVLLALLPNPQVLFLDELTTGLDTAARREVWNILKSLKEKHITIFLTSHYMDEVEALCDRICILKQGKELVSGSVQEVIAKSPYDKLEEAYLWYTGEEIAI